MPAVVAIAVKRALEKSLTVADAVARVRAALPEQSEREIARAFTPFFGGDRDFDAPPEPTKRGRRIG